MSYIFLLFSLVRNGFKRLFFIRNGRRLLWAAQFLRSHPFIIRQYATAIFFYCLKKAKKKKQKQKTIKKSSWVPALSFLIPCIALRKNPFGLFAVAVGFAPSAQKAATPLPTAPKRALLCHSSFVRLYPFRFFYKNKAKKRKTKTKKERNKKIASANCHYVGALTSSCCVLCRRFRRYSLT